MADKLITTASQTAGPFFHFGLLRPEWADLTNGGKAKGEKIVIEGRISDGDGAPLSDALVEIWQANAAGKYAHPDDRQDKPADANFRGFGRAFTDQDGLYRFVTVKPGAVPARGNALQAPHIAVTIAARGVQHHLHTRLYFAGEAANKTDPVLAAVDDPAAQRTLLAQPGTGSGAKASDSKAPGSKAPGSKVGGAPVWRFDIVLQGPGETVFFDF